MDKLKEKRVLVTGGAGFIGSHIVEGLLNKGVKYVRIIDNLSTGSMNNIKHLLEKYDNLEFMFADISDYGKCVEAVKDIDLVCHQAAMGSIPRSIADPLTTHNSNVNGFINILHATKEAGIKRFVFASSGSIYGDDKHMPRQEEYVGRQSSLYAVSKYVDELYASIYHMHYNVEVIGLRYFNVFGPRQKQDGMYAAVIPKFITQIKNNETATINGDGSYSRDFTYVANIVEANIKALTTINGECFGQMFNIGAGGNITILELYNKINEIIGKDIKPTFKAVRKGDFPYSSANISKAQKLLGYDVIVPFEDGLRQTCFFFARVRQHAM
jgi:UDP-N-acetylglucosamine 4-epimerase